MSGKELTVCALGLVLLFTLFGAIAACEYKRVVELPLEMAKIGWCQQRSDGYIPCEKK